MKLIKENFWPTVIILVASFAVIFAFWPLENTEFAEGFRTGEVEEGEGGEEFGEEGRLTGIAVLAPVIKVAIFMLVGVLFTSIGKRIGRLFRRLTAGSSPTT